MSHALSVTDILSCCQSITGGGKRGHSGELATGSVLSCVRVCYHHVCTCVCVIIMCARVCVLSCVEFVIMCVRVWASYLQVCGLVPSCV